MPKRNENIFQKLGRLFRSGPVVRRKLVSVDTTIAVPGRGKSTAARVFQRSVTPTYQQVTHNAFTVQERLARYQDFQEMEQTPELSAALNIIADETTASDEHGRVLHVYSTNTKIRSVLEDLFSNNLNVEFNLRPWVRNLAKYGDLFCFLDVSPEYGVINAIPIPVNHIERIENYDASDPFAVKFRWLEQNRELDNWEVAHMRLLGNDAFLPYGASILDGARRVWRQLVMLEDAMLTYRITRAPERRVFYIDVGAIPPDEVQHYMEGVKMQLRGQKVPDSASGRGDIRYNPQPIAWYSKVPLLDGRTLTMKELAEEFEAGKENWVYSVQDGTHRIVPGKVKWCGKNYTAERIVRVHLDDGSYVDSAPEHPFMLRDGGKRAAGDLNEGDALMPLYLLESSKDFGDEIEGYTKVYDPCTGRYKFVHRVIANSIHRAQREAVRNVTNWTTNNNLVVHHIDCDRKNNAPENLMWIGNVDHIRMHGYFADFARQNIIKYNKSPLHSQRTIARNKRLGLAQKMGEMYNGTDLHKSHNAIRRVAQQKSWAENRESRAAGLRWKIPDSVIEKLVVLIKENKDAGRGKPVGYKKIHELLKRDSQFLDEVRKLNGEFGRPVEKLTWGPWLVYLEENGHGSYPEFREKVLRGEYDATYRNHKVVRLEWIDVPTDVYCMTVVGSNGEDDRHNFGVQGENQKTGKVFVFNSIEEDFFLPTRGTETGTKIDTLKGGDNTGNVNDVEYLQRKLFAALQIPRAYLGYEEALCLEKNQRIQLLTGQIITIEDLASRPDSNDLQDVWVWSADEITGAPIPGRVKRAWKTKEVTELYEVTLDSGSKVRCTGNHPFLCRDGVYRRADELLLGQSLMPVYRKLSSKIEKDFQNGYEKVWCNETNEWKFVHRLVTEKISIEEHSSVSSEHHHVIHHVDHDKLNNSPSNLMKMGKKSHAVYHALQAKNLLTEQSCENLRKVMQTEDYRKKQSENQKRAWKNDDGTRRQTLAEFNVRTKSSSMTLQEVKAIASTCVSVVQLRRRAQLSGDGLSGIILRAGEDPKTWLKANIASGLKCTFEELVAYCKTKGDITPKAFRTGEYEDLPATSRMVWSLLKSRGINYWGKFEREFLKNNHKVVRIERIKLDEPVPVYDIEMHGVPNFGIVADESKIPSLVIVHNSSKSSLAQLDVRFSRTISMIQRTVVAELNKIAMVHLAVAGYSDDDLVNFSLRLTNPSSVAQQQKLELIRSRFEIMGAAPPGLLSRDYLRRSVMGMAPEEIVSIEREIMEDAKTEAAREAAGLGGGAGGPEEGLAPLGGGGPPLEAPGPGGGELAPPGGAPPAPVTAGVRVSGDLILAHDDPEEEDDAENAPMRLSMKDDDAPVHVQSSLDRALYNRSRHRHSSARDTSMPNFRIAASSPSTRDIDDRTFMRSFASLGAVTESDEPGGAPEDPRLVGNDPALTEDMKKGIQKMRERFSGANGSSARVLSENASDINIEGLEDVRDD